MIDDFIKKKINTQLIIAEKLSNSTRPEAHDSAYLIIDHIMERIGMCIYYEEKISNKPQLKSRDKDAILDKIKRESFETKLECLFNKLGDQYKQNIIKKHEIRNDIQHKFITLNFSVDINIVKAYLQIVKEVLSELGWLKSINYEFIFKDFELRRPVQNFSKYIGIWKTEFSINNYIHKGLLHVEEEEEEEEGGVISAIMDLNWQSNYYNALREKLSVQLKGDKIILRGLNVVFQHRGDTNEKEYPLDNFVLELSEDGSSLKGKLVDMHGEHDVTFTRVV